MIKPRELKALLKLLRSQGCVSFECEGLKLLLDPQFKPEPPKAVEHIPGQLAAELNKAAPGYMGMTDEQVLMFSSEGGM